MDQKNISYTNTGEEKLVEQQFVFFRYKILIDYEFIKCYCKMKLPAKRVNKILVSRKINSLYSILDRIYIDNNFKFEDLFKKNNDKLNFVSENVIRIRRMYVLPKEEKT